MTISPRRRGPTASKPRRTATGAPSAAPRTPARLAGWVRREAVLALAGEGGTGPRARTARDRRHHGGCQGGMAAVLAPLAGAGTAVAAGTVVLCASAEPGRLGDMPGPAAPLWSGQAVEEAGNRPVAEHLADRAGQQRRDRQHRELVKPLLLRHRQGVGDDDLADPGVLQ